MMQSQRGLEEPFDGIAEITFESFETLKKGNIDPSAAVSQALLSEDETRFIDLSRSAILFTQANEVIV